MAKPFKYGFDHSTGDGQKRLMALSVGIDRETYISKWVQTESGKDHGADPLGNGTFRMVPSGDIVDLAERNKRLKP
jgi:hypothetical protein